MSVQTAATSPLTPWTGQVGGAGRVGGAEWMGEVGQVGGAEWGSGVEQVGGQGLPEDGSRTIRGAECLII